MRFYIERLILWPKNPKNNVHWIEFLPGIVNVVYGRSGTGKSSIISIVDYCLGSSKCAIPVGIIRESVFFYGLELNVRGRKMLVARQGPGSGGESNNLHLSDMAGDELPSVPEINNTLTQFKEKFNRLARVTDLSMGSENELSPLDGRPSYRDFASFNFLPQHIVANPNALFFKADSYINKEKLKRALPFALGVVDSRYLLAERERGRVRKALDELQKKQIAKREAFAYWQQDVVALWEEGVELGLLDVVDDVSFDQQVADLRDLQQVYLSGGLEDRLEAPNHGFIDDEYLKARRKEENLQREIDAARQRIRGLESLNLRAGEFSEAVRLEKDSVINIDWLKNSLSDNSECVVCGSVTPHSHGILEGLERELKRVVKTSVAMVERPIVDKEIDGLRDSLRGQEREIHQVRTRRLRLGKVGNAAKNSLGRTYHLLGRLQSLLVALSSIGGSDDVMEEMKNLQVELASLDQFFRNANRESKEVETQNKLGALIAGYAKNLGLEDRGSVLLDGSELTLRFHQYNSIRGDYLWELGSGANWMGYHLATFLALHEYLTEDVRFDGPVFSFMIIDQPSQVYFPSQSGINDLDGGESGLEGLRATRDDDVKATMKIFRVLNLGIKRTKGRCQIIVLEHADDGIWGGRENVKGVADWRLEGEGLIPNHWV